MKIYILIHNDLEKKDDKFQSVGFNYTCCPYCKPLSPLGSSCSRFWRPSYKTESVACYEFDYPDGAAPRELIGLMKSLEARLNVKYKTSLAIPRDVVGQAGAEKLSFVSRSIRVETESAWDEVAGSGLPSPTADS